MTRLSTALSFVLTLGLFLPLTAQAQTYVVTTTADCTGCGSLRDALTAAKNNGSGTIDLTAVSGSILLTESFGFRNGAVNFIGAGNVTINGAPGVALVWETNIISEPTVTDVTFGDIEIRLTGHTRLTTASDGVFTPSTRLRMGDDTRVIIGATTQILTGIQQTGTSVAFRIDSGGVLSIGEGGEDSTMWLSANGSGGTVQKVGAGTLTLGGSINWNTLVVAEGTLVLQPPTDGFHAFSGSIVNNTEVHLRTATRSGSSAPHLSPDHITGSGSIHKWGEGEWQLLFGLSTPGAGTFIHEGTLTITPSSLTGAIFNESVLRLRQFSGAQTFVGSITGSGRVEIWEGTVRFDTPQLYTGGTEIDFGATLALDAVDVLSPTGAMSVDGTLQLNASNQIGNLSGGSDGIVSLAGGAALTVNQASNTTFNGTVTGVGSFVKAGTGVLTLAGSTSHTGGTTVLAGTLAGTTSSLRGAIVNNAALLFDQAFAGTNSGQISGTGHVTFTGGGDYLLTGVNTYTGGTTLADGSLTGTSSSIQGDVVNLGAITFAQSATGVYSGSMSGTGSVTKTGSGTLRMTGSNSYSGGTTILAGTLVGTTSSLQGLIDNSASLVFDQSSNGTFSGAISGAGKVTKAGSGTVLLTGSQTYTGGTFVEGGTLAGDTSSLRGRIVNDATLEIRQQRAGTFSGGISGAGRVVKTGAGTLTFAGPNSYAGGTTIAGGVLAIASDASLGRASGSLAFDGGALQLGGVWSSSRATTFISAGTIDTHGFDAVLSGDLSGAGMFTKAGAGTLVLTGTSTRTGATAITGGTLIGNAANLTGSIANDALLIFDQTSAGTFGGAISGSGAVRKIGSGALTFSGSQTFTGLTDIAGGSLLLGGSLAGSVVARSGTTLGNVSATALTIGGDLSFASDSTYQAALSAGGTVGSLLVSGAADIEDATLHLAPDAAFIDSRSRVSSSVLLRAAAIDGGFAAITGVEGIADAFIRQRGSELHLHLIRNAIDFARFASSANGAALGAVLTTLQTGATGDLAVVLRELRALGTDAELATALDQVSGTTHATIAGAALLGASDVAHAIGLRTAARPGPWMQAIGASRSLDESVDPGAPTMTSYGTLLGYDRAIGAARVGVAGGYSTDGVEAFDQNGIDIKVYRGIVYGELGTGRWFVSAIGSGARHEVGGGRSMSFTARLGEAFGGDALFGGIDRRASFEYDAFEWSGTADAGARLARGGVRVRPSLGLQVIRLTRGSFSEGGADSLNLTFDEQSLQTETMRVRLFAERGSGRVVPRVDLRYGRELGDRAVTLDAAIAGAPFAVGAFQLPRQSFAASAGALFDAGPVSLSADYRFEAARGDRQHLLAIGIGR